MERIIFAGHFTIGEKAKQSQVATIKRAKKIEGQLAILVNNMDFGRKLRYYEISGKDAVIKHYGKRVKCGTHHPLCELPEFRMIPNIIEWNRYDEAIALVKQYRNTEYKLSDIVRTIIVPQLIRKRLELYDLDRSDVKIFTEVALRNFASHRLRSSWQTQKTSWLPQIQRLDLINDVKTHDSRTPTCGGIMLALYEKAKAMGYDEVCQIYPEENLNEIEHGTELCMTLHKAYPRDQRWQIDFHNEFISEYVNEYVS